jgi:glycine/D-amino acid oxidase-like deaminating enzyme
VVGAGIAGLCLARELARSGCQVTVLADPSASSASAAAAGLLQIAGGRISSVHLGLRQACLAYFAEFLDGLDGAPRLRGRGHLRLGGDVRSRAGFVSTLGGLGIVAKDCSQELLREMEPSLSCDGGVWLDNDSVDPSALLEALERELGSLSVVAQSGRAQKLEARGVVDSAGQIWAADVVALACGAGLGLLYEPGWGFREEVGWGATYTGEIGLARSVEGLGQTLVPISSRRWKLGGSSPWQDKPPLQAWVAWKGAEVSRLAAVRCAAPDGLPLAGAIGKNAYVLGGLPPSLPGGGASAIAVPGRVNGQRMESRS